MTQAGRRWRAWAGNAGLLVASLLVGLLVLELACRVRQGPATLLDWHNLAGRGHRFVPSPGRSGYDPRLGVVRLEIADNGVGVPPEVKARLFEPYFSTKPDGTGLGLAIVSAIVADHNGFVRVRDNLPRGSRFILEFPVRRQAAQLAAQARYGAYAGG